ncbi:hypothetical protein WA577_001646, partial [Blastocystis sp. JDR]
MPEYIVVCCYECKLFQGQQVNKQKKFTCKVCGAKQSVRHIFAKTDYPKNIRSIVQELNQKRVQMEEVGKDNQPEEESDDYIKPNTNREEDQPSLEGKESRWAPFMAEYQQKEEEEELPMDPPPMPEVTLQKPRRERARSRTFQSHKAIAPKPQSLLPKEEVVIATPPAPMEEPIYTTDVDRIEESKKHDDDAYVQPKQNP